MLPEANRRLNNSKVPYLRAPKHKSKIVEGNIHRLSRSKSNWRSLKINESIWLKTKIRKIGCQALIIRQFEKFCVTLKRLQRNASQMIS